MQSEVSNSLVSKTGMKSLTIFMKIARLRAGFRENPLNVS